MKKILFVTTTDYMIWNFLIPHIKEFIRLGHIVECACARTSFYFDELKNNYNLVLHEINFERFPFKVQNIKAYFQLKKLVKENNYDIIHCHNPVGGVLGRLVGHKFNKYVIYTAHGFHFFKGNNVIKNFIFKAVEKFCASYTDILITMNKEDYESALKFKLKKGGKVYYIPGVGLDLDKYKIDVDRIKKRNEIGLSNDEVAVVMAAEFIKRKNHISLIKAVKNIHINNLKVIFCGTGKLENKLKKYIIKNGLEDKFIFLGFRKDLNQILKISDIFVFPSYQEGLSVALMEAMAIGMPIIASKIRGNTDLIIDGYNGLLIDPKDVNELRQALIKLIQNNQYAQNLAQNNQNVIIKYSLNNVIMKLNEEIYFEVLENK